MVGYLHGVTVLGFFQVGQRIVDECATLFQSFTIRYGVAYFAAHSRRRMDAREDLVNSSKTLAYAFMPVFAGLALCADSLVMSIFGPGWEPAAGVFS
jgi:O-antigen/teichoic acid export membrane protein